MVLLTVALLSIAPVTGVLVWAAYFRKPSGGFDIDLGPALLVLLAVIVGMVPWLIYGLST